LVGLNQTSLVGNACCSRFLCLMEREASLLQGRLDGSSLAAILVGAELFPTEIEKC